MQNMYSPTSPLLTNAQMQLQLSTSPQLSVLSSEDWFDLLLNCCSSQLDTAMKPGPTTISLKTTTTFVLNVVEKMKSQSVMHSVEF